VHSGQALTQLGSYTCALLLLGLTQSSGRQHGRRCYRWREKEKEADAKTQKHRHKKFGPTCPDHGHPHLPPPPPGRCRCCLSLFSIRKSCS
jgi:hypothetical protein